VEPLRPPKPPGMAEPPNPGATPAGLPPMSDSFAAQPATRPAGEMFVIGVGRAGMPGLRRIDGAGTLTSSMRSTLN
jgi:hypothetical protein